MNEKQKLVVSHLEEHQQAQARAIFNDMDNADLEVRLIVANYYETRPPGALDEMKLEIDRQVTEQVQAVREEQASPRVIVQPVPARGDATYTFKCPHCHMGHWHKGMLRPQQAPCGGGFYTPVKEEED